ncbi:hypothetical protein CIB48_g264 [Xylaria polymorpha]|nr:hypothetical protein CIB48_g264 [Xylaria polymorpha]
MSGAPSGSGGGGSGRRPPPKQTPIPPPPPFSRLSMGGSGQRGSSATGSGLRQGPAEPETPSGQPRLPSRLPAPVRPSRGAPPMARPSIGNVQQMQPSTPSRHAGPSSGQESTQKTPTQASVSGQVRDPFATPRAPGPSGPVTRGGAVIKGHKKTGHGIEDVYPKAFLPLCRASFMKVADLETLRIVFTWQNDPDSPGARQATYTKNIIDREVRKIILVYSSNKLMCSLIKTLFPDVNTSSQTFNQYRTYAMTTFSNFKHEILWQNSYEIAVRWYNDFGNTKFLINPSKGHNSEAIKKLTKDWVYTQLEDSKVFKIMFRPVWQIVDYEATYGDKTDLPFYHYKVIAHTILIAVGRVYLVERELNRRPDNTYTVWHREIKSWIKSKDSREKVSDTFEALSSYKHFSQMELEDITWRETQGRSEDDVSSKRRASQLLEEAVISDSPPPQAKSKQPRHISPGDEMDIYGASPPGAPPGTAVRHGSQTSMRSGSVFPLTLASWQDHLVDRLVALPPAGQQFELSSRPSSSSRLSSVSSSSAERAAPQSQASQSRQPPSQSQAGPSRQPPSQQRQQRRRQQDEDNDDEDKPQPRRSGRHSNLRGRDMEFADVFDSDGSDRHGNRQDMVQFYLGDDEDDETLDTSSSDDGDETLDAESPEDEDQSSSEAYLEHIIRGRAGFH